ncbi:MAG: AsmA-like C-terminal region-containing protein, partial [Thermodesulfobacteriota bacterium]|nr:AsmA-like C-terminal region-containing protein [Thermodesulfobacteriota bacterium]
TSIDLNTWLGKGRIDWKQLEWSDGKDFPRFQAFGYDGTLALRPLSRLLHRLNVLSDDTNLSGHADIHTKVSSEKYKIAFEDTTINIDDFIYQQAKRRVHDKKISLHAKGHVNLKDRSARLAPLEIKTTAGNVAFPELSINDWNDIIHAVKGNGSAKLDLTALTTSLGDYLNLPAKTRIAGKAEIELKADRVAAKKQTLSLNCNFEPIRVDSAKRSLLAEDQITLGVELAGDLTTKNLSIKQMALTARPLSINAAGRISSQGTEHLLSVDGDLVIDLERLQNPLNELLGTEIIISGKSKRPFSVRIETKNGKWQDLYRHTDLTAALHADRIRGFGLEMKAIDMPVNIENNRLHSNLKGAVNEGELALQPSIDLAAKPLILLLPDDSTILNGTRLTRDMANELLTLIHPIFKGTTAVQGTVDLVMHQMSWPLAASARKDARFKGILKFKDVRLNAEGLIYDLLSAMKVDERDVFLDERTIEFSGQDGRIECSPLRISVKGYRMEVSGTMGFDGSLDYTAKIPITPEIVGEKVYPYVKETSLDIPIGGTVSHPKLNLDAFQTVVQKMIRQSGSRVLEEKAGELLKKLFK